MHPHYAELIEKAQTSHRNNRNPTGIGPTDVVAARLYAHAFRRHTIGAFDATCKALQQIPCPSPLALAYRARAVDALEDLVNQGMTAIPRDFRVVIDSLYRTHRNIGRVDQNLAAEYGESENSELRLVHQRFRNAMNCITTSNGIQLTQDTSAPDQECFVVPKLGITIVPLIYGDHHSWNLAYLSGQCRNVPPHEHCHGVEIHLGLGPTEGETILGAVRTPVKEGYAMPIPPQTAHGWVNHSDSLHHVPFIFGSQAYGGWGVFFDVEPKAAADQFRLVPREHAQFEDMVNLESSIEITEALPHEQRVVLISAEVTSRDASGGLELAISRICSNDFCFSNDDFRAVSVVRGQGIVSIEGIQITIARHDHFGIPAGMNAIIRQTGTEPLVVLDSLLRPATL